MKRTNKQIKEYLNKQIIERQLNNYNKTSKATKYHQYFIYNNILFMQEEKTINIDNVIIDRESKARGYQQKLRIRIRKVTKEQMIKTSKVIMTSKEFNKLCKQLELNKGETCEYLSCKALGKEYTRNNLRYDKGGDISHNGEEIQVKFENATIATFDLINRIIEENK